MQVTIMKASGASVTLHDVYQLWTDRGHLHVDVPPIDLLCGSLRSMTLKVTDEAVQITDESIKYTGPQYAIG